MILFWVIWIICGIAAAWINIVKADDYDQALSIIPELISAPFIVLFGPIALGLIIWDKFF